MTTLVYCADEHAFYTDGRATTQDGTILNEYENKIHDLGDGYVCAFSGSVGLIETLVENDLDLPPDVPVVEGDMASGFVYDPVRDSVFILSYLIQEDGHVEYHKSPITYNFGLGSGGDWALAALDMGKTPAEAIRYAATRDSRSNTEVNTIRLVPRTVEHVAQHGGPDDEPA